MSQMKATKNFQDRSIKQALEQRRIFVRVHSLRGIVEETSLVSKNIAAVVVVSHHTSIGNKVVRLRPVGVIKG